MKKPGNPGFDRVQNYSSSADSVSSSDVSSDPSSSVSSDEGGVLFFQRDIFPSGGLQIRIQIKIFIFREVLRIVSGSVGSGFAEVCNDQSDQPFRSPAKILNHLTNFFNARSPFCQAMRSGKKGEHPEFVFNCNTFHD